jgi:ornithine carbamoyltransferase
MQPVAMASAVPARDLTSDLSLSSSELLSVLTLAAEMKSNPARYSQTLRGQNLALLFEKPSLRTRFTFEIAAKQLGGDAVFAQGPIGGREPVKDIARNLERWTNGIVARTFSQQTVDELAEWAGVPVINALSDLYHPCQALADMQTIRECFGRWRGVKLAYVGDGNNVAHSLMLTGARLGMDVMVATPAGYEPNAEILRTAQELAAEAGASVQHCTSPTEAVAGAHAIYTDVWASMGQENEAEERKSVFASYQVNENLLGKARPDAVFLHCLPAHRGEEVTDGVMESRSSVVFQQSENRLHAQKALLARLLG